jgi:hypothetical protein
MYTAQGLISSTAKQINKITKVCIREEKYRIWDSSWGAKS